MSRASLARRTRDVAQARDRRAVSVILLTIGTGLLVAGAQLDSLVIVVVAGVVLGIVGGIFASDDDRAYLEGFSDGLTFEPADRPAGSDDTGRDGADVRGLPAMASVPDARGAGGRADPDQRGDAGAVPLPRDLTGFAAALGVDLPTRPAGDPFGPDGSPVTVAQGPRIGSVPPIPAAAPSGTVVAVPDARGSYRRPTRQIIEP